MTEQREVRRYRVHGRVQGVGFRAFVWRQGQYLKLDGWVRNRTDGTVEVLAATDPEVHDELRQRLEKGPMWSRVDSVDSEREPGLTEIDEGFSIARSD